MRLRFGTGRRGLTRIGLLTAVVTATWLAAPAGQTTTPLRLVSTIWPPFTNQPSQPRFALDLVEEAARRIGLTTHTFFVEAAKFTPSLLTGPFDGSGAVWKDAERERVLLFSRPYLENRLILVARRGGDVSAKTLAELKGKRIAIVEGYSYGDTIDTAGPTFVRSRSEEDSLELLLKSAVDYTLMDEIVVEYIVDHHPEEARTRLQFGARPLITRELFFAVRRSLPDAQSIVDRFNAELRKMITDHTYHKLLHVAWISVDVDGDGQLEYVPESDKAGPKPPERAYLLFSSDKPPSRASEPPRRFMFGGNIYTDWASVPNQFRSFDSNRPDPARSTATIFTFRW
jgi:polar amino acid transport system substrate-binding protein